MKSVFSRRKNSTANTRRKSLRSNSLFPIYPLAPTIGPSLLVAGLIAAAPSHPVSPVLSVMSNEDMEDDIDLDKARVVLKGLALVGDGGLGTPYVKGLAVLGLGIIDNLDTMQSNARLRKDIGVHILQLIQILHEGVSIGDECTPLHIIAFTSDLHRILRIVKQLSNYNRYTHFLKANDICNKLQRCDKLVQNSRDLFMVRAHVGSASRSKFEHEAPRILVNG